MKVCCIVFYVDMREKKQTVKYKQTLQHRNTGHNTVTEPTKGTNPIRKGTGTSYQQILCEGFGAPRLDHGAGGYLNTLILFQS